MATIFLTGCFETAQLAPSSRSEPLGSPAPASYAQFTDVPVPPGATMDVERSLVLGDRESWIGRLAFSTGFNAGKAYDFYFAEMPRFGWDPVTTVRAETSVLTYTRGDRAATIQIRSRTLGGARVSMIVSPKGKPVRNFGAPGGGPVQIQPLN